MSRRKIELAAINMYQSIDAPGTSMSVSFTDNYGDYFGVPTYLSPAQLQEVGINNILLAFKQWLKERTPFLVEWPPPEHATLKDIFDWLWSGRTAVLEYEKVLNKKHGVVEPAGHELMLGPIARMPAMKEGQTITINLPDLDHRKYKILNVMPGADAKHMTILRLTPV